MWAPRCVPGKHLAGRWLPLASRDPELSACPREHTCRQGRSGQSRPGQRGCFREASEVGKGPRVVSRERGGYSCVGRGNIIRTRNRMQSILKWVLECAEGREATRPHLRSTPSRPKEERQRHPHPRGPGGPGTDVVFPPPRQINVFSIQLREPGLGARGLVPVFYLCGQVKLPLWASVSVSQKWLSLPDPPPRGLESPRCHVPRACTALGVCPAPRGPAVASSSPWAWALGPGDEVLAVRPSTHNAAGVASGT